MPLVLSRNLEDAYLAIWHVTEPLQELVSNLFLDEQELVSNFKSQSRKREFAAWRMLAHQIMPDTKIEYSEQGAPNFFAFNQSLSVSHSGDYVSVIVSSKETCAVDIELKTRNVDRVLSRYLSEDELAFSDGQDFKILAWCAKEAVFKFCKRENVDFKQDIRIIDYKKDLKTMEICAFEGQIISLKFDFFEDLAFAYII